MTATIEEIKWAYRVLLGREPDKDGVHAIIEAKLPLELVVRGVMRSPEFYERHNAHRTQSIYGRPFEVPAVDWMYQAEEYEPQVFRPLMRSLRLGHTFLDVGANIGVFSVHAALRGANVIAVEALASNAALLLRNAALNSARVVLHPIAASPDAGYVRMQVGESLNAAVGSTGNIIAAAARLDTLIGSTTIDVLKIDVEGFEYLALQGALGLLSRRPLIFTEYSPSMLTACSGVSGIQYLEFLTRFGYTQFSLLRTTGAVLLSWTEIENVWSEQGSSHVDLMIS